MENGRMENNKNEKMKHGKWEIQEVKTRGINK